MGRSRVRFPHRALERFCCGAIMGYFAIFNGMGRGFESHSRHLKDFVIDKIFKRNEKIAVPVSRDHTAKT